MNSMLNKELVLETVKKLPASFTLDELYERLLLVEKIERGLADIEYNRLIADEKLDERLPEWLR